MTDLNILKTNSDCAQYTGTVTVASYLGDRLIKKETSHNKGLTKLFTFIGNCLQGHWTAAKANRPCKLVLLKGALGENLTDATVTLGESAFSTPVSKPRYWSAEFAACSPIMYDSAAVSEVTVTGDDTPNNAVTYHFRIPQLALLSGVEIKKLLLLPTSASNYAEEACAYFILQTPIKIPPTSGNITVIVDWTLAFTNAESD